jgi:hypothetical protein
MADMILLMKTIEHFAAPKKTKAQLEAEKLLKEEEERQAKMNKTQAKGTPAAPAKAPAAPAKAPIVPVVEPKKDDDKKGVVKNVLEKFQMDDGAVAGISIGSVIWWLFFFTAAYLSWTCNSKNSPGMDMVEKALRACVAGFFWFIYLILYFSVWADQCKKKV